MSCRMEEKSELTPETPVRDNGPEALENICLVLHE